MQIGSNQFYSRNASRMTQLGDRTTALQNQIATGKKLDAPSQDVVSYQKLAGLKQAGATDTAYSANISLAQSVLQQSDTTLSAIEDQIQRASELAIQANSGTLSDTARTTVATQLRGVLDDLVSLANTKDSRGQPLFGAATGDSAVTIAANGSVRFTGTGTPPAIPIGDGALVQANDSAERVFGNVPTASGPSDTFAIIGKLADALDAGGPATAAAGEAVGALKSALTQVTGVHGAVGARAARVDLQAAQLKDNATSREISRSALEDTDVTAAVTELQKTMTILQATQASFTKLSALSLFDYMK